jgi:hypothetical protein
MNARINMTVDSLPNRLKSELHELGYRRADVCMMSADTVHISSARSAGEQAFAVVLHGNGRKESYFGSWGGPCIASRTDNPVDNLRAPPTAIPDGGAIITGAMKRTAITATVYVLPSMFATMHSPEDAEIARDEQAEGRTDIVDELRQPNVPVERLSEEERRVMYCYGALKSGEYRKNALAEIARKHRCDTSAIVDSLVSRGYLKRATNGATQITTLGKNSRTMAGNSSEIW